MSDRDERVNVCPRDGEPVVFTFEFPGAEYHCVACGWIGGVLTQGTRPVTPELLARQEELAERYDRERAERTGHAVIAPPQDIERPTCSGCGKVAQGRLDHSGKPAHWYSRTIDGATEFACSRDCITEGAMLPW